MQELHFQIDRTYTISTDINVLLAVQYIFSLGGNHQEYGTHTHTEYVYTLYTNLRMHTLTHTLTPLYIAHSPLCDLLA